MARRIALAAIVAATAAALAACAVGGPPVGPLAAGTAGSVSASAPVTTGPSAVPDDTDPSTGNVSIGGIPLLPQLSLGLPDLGAISVGGISLQGGSLPAGFPTPPGATSIGVVTAESDIAAQLRVSDPSAAYDFWLAALPRAGYTVGASGLALISGVVHAGITFRGHGYQSASAIGIVGTTVTIGFVGTGSGGRTIGNPPPGAPNGTIIIQNSAVHLTRACAQGAPVNIVGSGDDITLTGDCGAINVIGSGNHVVVDSAVAVNLTGSDDDVTVHRGNPQVTKIGMDDEFHIG